METKRKIVNYLSYQNVDKGEFNSLPSETVPNQAFTVSEVLLRFSQGTLPNIELPVYYDDTEDFDNIDLTTNPAFDLVDADNYLKALADKNETSQEKTTLSTQKSQTNEQKETIDDKNSGAEKTSQ